MMLLAALRQHKLKVLQLTSHLNPENKKVPVGLSSCSLTGKIG
jgi:hypothetical protein